MVVVGVGGVVVLVVVGVGVEVVVVVVVVVIVGVVVEGMWDGYIDCVGIVVGFYFGIYLYMGDR